MTDEDAWLNRLADEAEAEGREGSISLEEMAALLGADPDRSLTVEPIEVDEEHPLASGGRP